MSAAGPPPGDPYGAGAPGEEELREQRAAYEAELARITVPDMLMQATVSLLNLAAHRLVPAPPGAEGQGGGRDLEQVRDAIDGVRALLDILERRMPGELKPLREALSQLQMAYAAEVARPAAGQPGAEQAGSDQGSGDEGAGGSGQPGGDSRPGDTDSGPGGGDSDPGGGDPDPGGDDSEPGGGDSGPGGGDRGPGGSGPGPGGAGGGGAPAQPAGSEQQDRGPGPAESSGRLWVPGR